jgi:hypothetical protein
MNTCGRKDDSEKLRYDLVPVWAEQQAVKIFTMGAQKYGDRNWERGMQWSRLIAALKRHLAAFEVGEDYDPESGYLHAAHITANALMLTEYYRINPEGDNRQLQHQHTRPKRIGLDIDDVLADWVGHYKEHFDLPKDQPVQSWFFDPNIKDRLGTISDNDEFWLTMPMLTAPKDIPFEPSCYITSRPCPPAITQKWLQQNGYPLVPLYSVGPQGSKVDAAKEARLDIFVDDRYEHFRDLNNAGVCCYLFSAEHNQKYSVGHKRIDQLAELPFA